MVYDVAFSPDGKILATAQRYSLVRLFDTRQLGLED
jgi:WD40 repeat protein